MSFGYCEIILICIDHHDAIDLGSRAVDASTFGRWNIGAFMSGSVCSLRGPDLHFVEACLLGILEGDGAGWACFGAGRAAKAGIAFDDLTGGGVVIDRAEGARNRTNLATDAQVFVHDLDAIRVGGDGVHRTSLLAPSLGALRAGVGDEACFGMKIEHTNARFGDVEFAFLDVGAGHFALLAASAFSGVNHQCSEHGSSLWVAFLVGVRPIRAQTRRGVKCT